MWSFPVFQRFLLTSTRSGRPRARLRFFSSIPCQKRLWNILAFQLPNAPTVFVFNIFDPTLWPKNETHGPCGNVAMVNLLHAMIFGTSQDPQQRSPHVLYFFGTKISTADKLSRYRGGHADLCLGWWLWNKPFFRMSGWFLVVVLNISSFTYTGWNDGLNPPTSIK